MKRIRPNNAKKQAIEDRAESPRASRQTQLIRAACLLAVLAIPTANAQTVTSTILHSFSGADGRAPFASLVQDGSEDFYGTTYLGGSGNVCDLGCGTIFQISASGAFTTLYSFSAGADSAEPYDNLILGTDGNFYGTTAGGGAELAGGCLYSCGSIFRITSTGSLTTLYSFSGYPLTGAEPFANLIQTSDGSLVGTTALGGTYSSCGSGTFGCGTVFELSPSGTLSSFSLSGSNGEFPSGNLTAGTDGNYYGTTQGGGNTNCGNAGCGTVFKVSPSGVITTLHAFAGTPDGYQPYAGLLLGSNGNFYGTTELGGTNNYGTIFMITPAGVLTTLHSFDGTDGKSPRSALVEDAGGNLYGTTYSGGPVGFGTVFQLAPSGVLTMLHGFQTGTDGEQPVSGVIIGSDGALYGTTSNGGAVGYGTIFKLQLPPGPSAPTDFSAAGKLGGYASLGWTAAPGATSYNVYEGTSAGQESTTPIATGIVKARTIISGLTARQNYCFTVAGVDAAGLGLPSNESCMTAK